MWAILTRDVGALSEMGAANHAAREFLRHPTTCAAADAILMQLTNAAGLRLPWWRGLAAWAGRKALVSNASSIRNWKAMRGC